MRFVKNWVETEKTPIPQKAIIQYMMGEGVKRPTVINAINALLHKEYLRRGYSPRQNVSVYVQIRNIRDIDPTEN